MGLFTVENDNKQVDIWDSFSSDGSDKLSFPFGFLLHPSPITRNSISPLLLELSVFLSAL